MENVAWAAGAGGADLAVEVCLLPGGEAEGLVGRQVGLHGEGGLREVERRFERLAFGHGLLSGRDCGLRLLGHSFLNAAWCAGLTGSARPARNTDRRTRHAKY